MSKNSKYAQDLVKVFDTIPTVAVRAVGQTVYTEVLRNTVQDSGQAAYNWRAQINTNRRYLYRDIYGIGPVGYKGDKRSLGIGTREIVINERVGDFLQRVSGKSDIKFILIYNPIEDPDHAAGAKLTSALGAATGRDFLESVAKRAVDAYLIQSSQSNH